MGTDRAGSVTAIVVSRDRAALERCLRAVAGQSRPPDEIIVFDDAGEPPIPAPGPADGPPVRIVRSDVPVGPAGGFARALGEFVASSADYAWVLDDDIVPEPECLATLRAEAAKAPETAFVFPRSIQPDGSIGRWGSWCGFIVARSVVETVGVPMAELFWWGEDLEYCQWRIPRAGYHRRVVREAVVYHAALRRPADLPAWQYYYQTRNLLHLHLHVMHRLGWYPRNMARLLAHCLVRQRRGRLAGLVAVGRGLVDGYRGRLGIRYPVGDRAAPVPVATTAAR